MKLLFAVACVAVIASNATWAADLNAPVINQPTIGSEIARGTSAAGTCIGESDPIYSTKCVFDASSANRQRQSNFKPFELGLFLNTWDIISGLADIAKAFPNDEVVQTKFRGAQSEALVMFVLFRKIQKDLHITDAQLVAACPFTPEGREMVRKKISNWANSHPEGK
jgi:hypothetical protein